MGPFILHRLIQEEFEERSWVEDDSDGPIKRERGAW